MATHQMEMATCKVQLGDDNNNFKRLKLVTPAEAVILIAIHSGARVTQFVQHHPDAYDLSQRPIRDTNDSNGIVRPGELERLKRKYNTKPNVEDWIVDKLFPPGRKLPMTFEEVGIQFVEEVRYAPVPNEPDAVQTQADADLAAAEPPIANPVLVDEVTPEPEPEAEPEQVKRGPGRPKRA